MLEAIRGSMEGFDVKTALSVFKGLAAAGYLSPDHLPHLEAVLLGRPVAKRAIRWLSIAAACKYAKISRSTLWRYKRSGRLSFYDIGGRSLVDRDELNALIRFHKV